MFKIRTQLHNDKNAMSFRISLLKRNDIFAIFLIKILDEIVGSILPTNAQHYLLVALK